MIRAVKVFLLVLICCLLSACSTTNSTAEKENAKKNKIAEINIQLGMAYLQKGDIERAKQKLLYALQKAPELPEAWYSIGYFYESTGNKKQAQHSYLKAVQLAPERGDVLNNYGTYLCRTGDYANAIHYFLLATKDAQYLDTAGAYENAGLCSMNIPDRKQALLYFNQALEVDPSRKISITELSKLQQP